MPFDGIYNEPELLRQISHGDRDAFRALYHHYYAYIQRYIALFESSGDYLDELTQDVFVRIWEKRGHLEKVESLRSYLFLISRNIVFNYLRSLKVQQKVKELEGLPDPAGDDLEDQMLFKQYYRIALEAMDKLPPGRRKVLKMSIDDGLSLDEIAQELHISRAGVKKQLYAATAFVRQYLHEHGEMTVLLLIFLSLFEC
ncbi:RNA polymerase sigma factor [Puia dinghuensis]|uniref:DNA-directed RNA polymerase sigma-70 factor n=1 Tax=Puia dinghuensis TaxID=1792502 RepID=A0A8J2UB32_9BACT|nr:sigma-70 family RNA polymerase sigma factor [Puia dinghuensis]GGA92170.1 DNA-directed RNA polymerase sigma-70 factor [Puia dinghuensis]